MLGPDEYPGSITLDLDGDYAYVTCDGVLRKIKLNGPTGTMAIEETLDLTEATGDYLGEFLVGLYDPLTGLFYLGAGA